MATMVLILELKLSPSQPLLSNLCPIHCHAKIEYTGTGNEYGVLS